MSLVLCAACCWLHQHALHAVSQPCCISGFAGGRQQARQDHISCASLLLLLLLLLHWLARADQWYHSNAVWKAQP
jgi:hypothetical protein